MKLLVFTFLILACSCLTTKRLPLKGNYFTPPFVITTATPKDLVWDKLIDLFAQNGLSIKIIDRSSGLITSEAARLSWSNETKNGELVNKDAIVAVPQKIFNGKTVKYDVITGEWNVRIKAGIKDSTIINVNIVNIKETYYSIDNKSFPIITNLPTARSTGVFERTIVNAIK